MLRLRIAALDARAPNLALDATAPNGNAGRVRADQALDAADTVAPNPALDATQSDTVRPNAFDATLASSAPGPHGARPDYTALVAVNPDHYAIDKESARGGMGRISPRAIAASAAPVAVKELLGERATLRARFEREARITARLQHPAIVPIHEAGRWPRGEPFYAMKLVAGPLARRGDRATRRRSRSGSRSCRTSSRSPRRSPTRTASASSTAISSRQNVLVGAFGETVVIDWGLAKDLADAGDATPTPRPAIARGARRPTTVARRGDGHAGVHAARAGRGEPRRRARRRLRARRDPLPPARGRAAVRRTPTRRDARRGDAGRRRRSASVEPGVPRDLARDRRQGDGARSGRALPDRARARRGSAPLSDGPARRRAPLLAGELVRRWLRRHRAAVTVAGVAVIVLLVLGAVALQRIIHAQYVAEEQRTLAEQQRARAVASRGDAEELLGFMLVNMRDKLRSAGRLDLLDDVAKKAGRRERT